MATKTDFETTSWEGEIRQSSNNRNGWDNQTNDQGQHSTGWSTPFHDAHMTGISRA